MATHFYYCRHHRIFSVFSIPVVYVRASRQVGKTSSPPGWRSMPSMGESQMNVNALA